MSRIDDALRDLTTLDALALQVTAWGRFDPRAKIITTFAFILTVASFDRYAVAALLPFGLFPVISAALGAVPFRLILRKLIIASPFALTIGLFNPFIDHTPMLVIYGIEISGGWLSFCSLMIRFVLTVSAALILVGGTGFHTVCVGLSQLGVPQVFTNQLLFLYRYTHVLSSEAARMNAARELRASGNRMGLAIYGSLLGHLLLRALERAQRIHLAMVSRGFNGKLHTSKPLRWHTADTALLLGCGAYLILARSQDLSQMLGKLLTGTLV